MDSEMIKVKANELQELLNKVENAERPIMIFGMDKFAKFPTYSYSAIKAIATGYICAVKDSHAS